MPIRYNYSVLDDVEGHMAYHTYLLDDVPKDFKDVSNRCDEAEWRVAIEEEFDSLAENGTWSMVWKPSGVKLFGSLDF